jgi:hypothetical protein
MLPCGARAETLRRTVRTDAVVAPRAFGVVVGAGWMEPIA